MCSPEKVSLIFPFAPAEGVGGGVLRFRTGTLQRT